MNFRPPAATLALLITLPVAAQTITNRRASLPAGLTKRTDSSRIGGSATLLASGK